MSRVVLKFKRTMLVFLLIILTFFEALVSYAAGIGSDIDWKNIQLMKIVPYSEYSGKSVKYAGMKLYWDKNENTMYMKFNVQDDNLPADKNCFCGIHLNIYDEDSEKYSGIDSFVNMKVNCDWAKFAVNEELQCDKYNPRYYTMIMSVKFLKLQKNASSIVFDVYVVGSDGVWQGQKNVEYRIPNSKKQDDTTGQEKTTAKRERTTKGSSAKGKDKDPQRYSKVTDKSGKLIYSDNNGSGNVENSSVNGDSQGIGSGTSADGKKGTASETEKDKQIKSSSKKNNATKIVGMISAAVLISGAVLMLVLQKNKPDISNEDSAEPLDRKK